MAVVYPATAAIKIVGAVTCLLPCRREPPPATAGARDGNVCVDARREVDCALRRRDGCRWRAFRHIAARAYVYISARRGRRAIARAPAGRFGRNEC